MTVVLDAEALSMIARSPEAGSAVSATLGALVAAQTDQSEILVPAAVLAELYRGRQYDQLVDACLSRFPAITVVETDRSLAREIGHVLARAGRGSADHVDASVVAVAVRSRPAVIATADVDDIAALAAEVVGVRIERV